MLAVIIFVGVPAVRVRPNRCGSSLSYVGKRNDNNRGNRAPPSCREARMGLVMVEFASGVFGSTHARGLSFVSSNSSKRPSWSSSSTGTPASIKVPMRRADVHTCDLGRSGSDPRGRKLNVQYPQPTFLAKPSLPMGNIGRLFEVVDLYRSVEDVSREQRQIDGEALTPLITMAQYRDKLFMLKPGSMRPSPMGLFYPLYKGSPVKGTLEKAVKYADVSFDVRTLGVKQDRYSRANIIQMPYLPSGKYCSHDDNFGFLELEILEWANSTNNVKLVRHPSLTTPGSLAVMKYAPFAYTVEHISREIQIFRRSSNLYSVAFGPESTMFSRWYGLAACPITPDLHFEIGLVEFAPVKRNHLTERGSVLGNFRRLSNSDSALESFAASSSLEGHVAPRTLDVLATRNGESRLAAVPNTCNSASARMASRSAPDSCLYWEMYSASWPSVDGGAAPSLMFGSFLVLVPRADNPAGIVNHIPIFSDAQCQVVHRTLETRARSK
ncbi:hypothetical protein CHU98_g8510 [Xylaria longipes]|nr:hypothetical protein CHU98_g8510 [Xylaria longipes]